MTPGAGIRFLFAVGVCPLNATMPGCRAPIPSKGKQRFGALSSVERSIELTTAVKSSWERHKPARNNFFRNARSDQQRKQAAERCDVQFDYRVIYPASLNYRDRSFKLSI